MKSKAKLTRIYLSVFQRSFTKSISQKVRTLRYVSKHRCYVPPENSSTLFPDQNSSWFVFIYI